MILIPGVNELDVWEACSFAIGTNTQETLHDFFFFYIYLFTIILREGRWFGGAYIYALAFFYLFVTWFAVEFFFQCKLRQFTGRGKWGGWRI